VNGKNGATKKKEKERDVRPQLDAKALHALVY